jgi:hypothetical protein
MVSVMAKETIYLLQSFIAGRGKGLRAQQAVVCKSAEEARRKAERLAPLRLGVVAYSMCGDSEMGDFDELPTIIFKSGQLPPPFDE